MKRLIKNKSKKEQIDDIFNRITHLNANELPVPIYLNQEVIFNLIAIFEDGFSKLSTLKTSTNKAETNEYGASGSIGVSNAFALLGVSFSGERRKGKSKHDQTEISQEKVHTPTSLFAKCRKKLIEENLLHDGIEIDSLRNLNTGDFVEIKVTLRKNPIQEVLSWIKALMEMFIPFATSSGQGKHSFSQKKSSQPSNKEMLKQFDAILSMVTEQDVVELVGESVDASGLKIVVSCQTEFFNRRNPTEIVDGEFYVLGKIIQLARKSGEAINLLRKTTLGRLDSDTLNQLTSAFASLEENGFQEINVSTLIEAPAILIFPIAIYL